MNIKEAAKAYEPTTTKNISELEEVSVDCEIKTETGVTNDGKEFKYDYIVVNGEKYRVPVTVKRDLKMVLERKPDLKSFSVGRTGSTKEDTRYTVIPL